MEWFDKIRCHPLNNIQIVRKSNRYNIISINDIFRPIHLIPEFHQNTYKFRHCIQEFDVFWVNHYIDQHSFVTCY